MKAQSVLDIGRIIAMARRHRALTQAQLAHAVGASQNWISEVEAGKPTAQIGKVLGLLSFLGVRLGVEEAPWDGPKPKSPARAKGIALADVIETYRLTPARSKAGKP